MKLDAIIILGGGIEANGELKIPPKERLEELLKHKELAGVPVIISGRHGFSIDYKPPTTEAHAMRDYLKMRGWPSKIYIEEESLDTIGNAYFSKQIIDRRGWRNILILTSDYHMERTQWIFRKIFNDGYKLEFLSAPSIKFQEKQEKEKRALAVTKKFWRHIGMQNPLKHHPYYSQTPEALKILQEMKSFKEK